MDYILDIVFKTRETNNYIACGASPRVTIALVVSARQMLSRRKRSCYSSDIKELS